MFIIKFNKQEIVAQTKDQMFEVIAELVMMNISATVINGQVQVSLEQPITVSEVKAHASRNH